VSLLSFSSSVCNSGSHAAKGASKLAPVCVKCLCDLLREKTNFNFSVNIMDVVVRKLGAQEWDEVGQQLSSSSLVYN
jgi:hypothetical protein